MHEQIYYLNVKALIQNGEANILLLRGKHGFAPHHPAEDCWDIPGGQVLEGDSPEHTLLNLIKQTTALQDFAIFTPLGLFRSTLKVPTATSRKAGLVFSIYYCKLGSCPPITLKSPHIEYNWVAPQKAAALLLYKYPKPVIEEILKLSS